MNHDYYFRKLEYTMQRPYYIDSIIHNLVYHDTLKDNVLVFIHPFYPEILASNFKECGESRFIKTNDYADYKKGINELINTKLPNDWSKLLVTFPEDYYLNFKESVEARVFDDAMLSVFGGGYLVNNNEISRLLNKKLVIAGCYVEDCINDFVELLINFGTNNFSLLINNVLFAQKSPEGILRSNSYLLSRYVSDRLINKIKGV